MYSYEIADGEKYVMKSKGVNKSVIRTLKFQDYENALFNKNTLRKTMYRIQHKNLNLNTLRVCKIALDDNDNKQFILSDNIHTLPYNHYLLNKLKDNSITQSEIIEKIKTF
jgi:hypothetical protein